MSSKRTYTRIVLNDKYPSVVIMKPWRGSIREHFWFWVEDEDGNNRKRIFMSDMFEYGEVHAYMVEPTTVVGDYEEIGGVNWDEFWIQKSLGLDTRTRARLVVPTNSWDGKSWIRIVYETESLVVILGTFIVVSYEATCEKTDLTLESPLWALNQVHTFKPFSFGERRTCSDVLTHELKELGFAHSLKGMIDTRLIQNQRVEVSCSVPVLEWPLSVAKECGNDVDVNGYGVITVSEKDW